MQTTKNNAALDALSLTLTRTQGEAFRYLADEDASMEKVIASRPSTDTYLLLRIENKTQARKVCKNFRAMIENLTDEERTGPSVKMAYAIVNAADEFIRYGEQGGTYDAVIELAERIREVEKEAFAHA